MNERSSIEEQGRPKQLGRGLAALLEDDASETAESERTRIDSIPVDRISPSRIQVRRSFGKAEIEELVASIRSQGILQPLLLRPHPEITGQYELLAGERRWRAARIAGLGRIPALVRQFSDQDATEVSLIENLQRADLNPLEEATGYQRLMEQHGYTKEKVAERVGKSRSHVTNLIRLLSLPDPVKMQIQEGKLTAGHARALLATDNPVELAAEAMAKGLTVRDLEALGRARQKRKEAREKAGEKDQDVAAIEENLFRALGLRVEIKGKSKGVVKIAYDNLDQLDQLVQRLIVQGARQLADAG